MVTLLDCPPTVPSPRAPIEPREILARLGATVVGESGLLARCPFAPGDVTAGTEHELLAAVEGDRESVDLPLTIERSNYFSNLARHAAAGETSRRPVGNLADWISDKPGGLWENSWTRFPRDRMNAAAAALLEHDLQADKSDPLSPPRGDLHRFLFQSQGESWVRVPVSYLIKLALAQWIGEEASPPPRALWPVARRLMAHFLSDNTSPETYSFHVSRRDGSESAGATLARESAKRFLTTHLLLEYANETLKLGEAGQRATICFSPLPPRRQQSLNDFISDAFYRELFMSPCLSGWDQGEAKHRYMHLCHQVLSRSQLNAVAKLREAGMIVNNLVVLPNLSNVSLANNGVHVSLGSRMLTAAAACPEASGYGPAAEKSVNDLVIKIVEHFLPLFVGTVSAAPGRVDFWDFHPEKVLGFLPHELDYTHLRMTWRRWKKKAGLKILGHSTTPLGPTWLDRLTARVFRLRGDWAPDRRLLDYLVAVLSTDASPALDGATGNVERLKADLAQMGVFDEKMSIYMLYRAREFGTHGFCGFEGRHYSLFERFGADLGLAADLQALVTALAHQWIAQGQVGHLHVPDSRHVESERRQIFFAAAIGLSVFNVDRDTRNALLRRILRRADRVVPSRRYPGYDKVPMRSYLKALLAILREDGAALVEAHGMAGALDELEARVDDPDGASAAGRLNRGILDEAGARDALSLDGDDYQRAAERFYRGTLRRRHLAEALEMLAADLERLEAGAGPGDEALRQALAETSAAASSSGGSGGAAAFVRSRQSALLSGALGGEPLRRLLALLLASLEADRLRHEGRRP